MGRHEALFRRKPRRFQTGLVSPSPLQVLPGVPDAFGLLIIVLLFARRWLGRLLTAASFTALLTLALYRLPPRPAYGLALLGFTALVFVWRVLLPRRGD